MPVLQKKALFSAFIICQVLRIIQNYMEVSPAKSLILSATIHGGSYFFIQPMTNTKLFIGCTAGTVLIFAVVYGLIYLMTARSYYHIVERK